MECQKIIAVAGITQCVTHFEQDRVGRNNSLILAPMFRRRAPVGGIFRIEQRDEMKAVSENGSHFFFGWPLT